MKLSRRQFIRTTAVAAAFPVAAFAEETAERPLEEVGYDQVAVHGDVQTALRENVTGILMGFDEASLLKPFLEMAGKPAPGVELGGWYAWRPNYDRHHDDAGFAPGHSFGQWVSAMARLSTASHVGNSGEASLGERADRLNSALGACISPAFFASTRFPAYTLDKLVCGLFDGHRLLGDKTAYDTLDRVIDAAKPSLPGHAIDREEQWKIGADISYMWDESFTLPENLLLARKDGANPNCSQLGIDYLLDKTYFEPLSRGVNVLSDKHAYSYVNALCSAMQAWFALGSQMHLEAAKNGFDLLQQQSFATGGWGPEELLRKPGIGDLTKSVVASHNGFETPCGGYAHMKLTRYLLRATRDGMYGDSMEAVLHNAVLGSLPLQASGLSFYNSDYNVMAKRSYSVHQWPCCSGTLPQVVADLGINTYLREPGAVWVNLYQPSVLRWTEHGHAVVLEQTGSYPLESTVKLRITTTGPSDFALKLRIPAWVRHQATLTINGVRSPIAVTGGFTTISRRWRSGDRVELNLPMPLRLEPFPAVDGPLKQPVAALMRGPLVLFAVRTAGETGVLRVPEDALLKAQQSGPATWTVNTPTGTRDFVPFTAIGDRNYTTYVTLA